MNFNRYLLLLLGLIVGCGGSATSPGPGGPSGEASADRWHNELFTYAIDNLNRLEQFDTGEMVREIAMRLERSARGVRSDDALMETWPQPEMLRQIVNRLNQWIRVQKPPKPWRPDPIVESLPKPLRELPLVEGLGKLEFCRYDGFALREVVWLRDISNWARGRQLNDLDRAKELFDWTVRNIQLESDTLGNEAPAVEHVPQVPWETIMFGRGTAVERAWVFILLARQQGIDAAMLAVGESLRSWAVGVLVDDELYLFDLALGLPIPAPDGVKLDQSGQFDIRPATLQQVVADEMLLRQLDVDESNPYPVKASDLERVVALVEASPVYLARRMEMIESRLVGKQKMVLSIDATAQAARFAACRHVSGTRLWTLPYETLLRRSQLPPEQVQKRLAALLPFYAMPGSPLRKARMLYINGDFTGTDGATVFYQHCRPANRVLAAAPIHRMEKAVYSRAKQDASYWLGLLAFQRAKYSSAADYFARRVLEASPGGPWTHGAMYNLARTYEASGRDDKAIELYRSDTNSPAYHGNVLRSRYLAAVLAR